jgi:hypothetical protein
VLPPLLLPLLPLMPAPKSVRPPDALLPPVTNDEPPFAEPPEDDEPPLVMPSMFDPASVDRSIQPMKPVPEINKWAPTRLKRRSTNSFIDMQISKCSMEHPLTAA